MHCPACGKALDPARHGELVFDGQVWCDQCHLYERALIRPRDFEEIQEWGARICTAFEFENIPILQDPQALEDPSRFRKEHTVLMAEADHREGSIILYPSGYRLTTLCHELAHIATGQDHSREWARLFARLVAWVKAHVPKDRDTAGIYVNLLK